MAHPDGGRGSQFQTRHSFKEAFQRVSAAGMIFRSTTNESIHAVQGTTRSGDPAITFQGENSRHGNVCAACWGFSDNCSGTHIGQCVKALDDHLSDANNNDLPSLETHEIIESSSGKFSIQRFGVSKCGKDGLRKFNLVVKDKKGNEIAKIESVCWMDLVPDGNPTQSQNFRDDEYRIPNIFEWNHDGTSLVSKKSSTLHQLISRAQIHPTETLLRKESAGLDDVDFFNPASLSDARSRTVRSIAVRRGQSKFREQLISRYGGKCAISGESEIAVLEAAHIIPYLGPPTNSLQNGLLLRADLHTLFDLGYFSIDPATRCVVVSSCVSSQSYLKLRDTPLAEPFGGITSRPATEALEYHFSNIFRR